MDTNLNQQKGNYNPVRILLHIPVPWVFVLGYVVGLIPQFIFPVTIHSHLAMTIIKIGGLSLFAIGAFFAAWSLIIFHKAQNTTTPGESSKKLVMSGPYRISRNPMYLSLSFAYLGEAGILIQLWPVILLPLTLAYVNLIVIPLEEEVLIGDFKEEYRKYCTRVHRWI
jgi:protein-S-isoprenylcysteine O-methyltransferase Ste14